MKNECERIESFDSIRAMACMAIILLHVVSTWRDDPLYGYTYYNHSTIDTIIYHYIIALLVRWCVPAFFMMSGVLFTRRSIDVQKHIIKSVVIIVIFGTVYSLIEIIVSSKTFGVRDLGKAILYMIQGRSWAHMWFMYAIVGCYILTPFIKEYISKVDGKGSIKMLSVLILLLSVIPTINDMAGLKITSFGIADYSGAILYFVTGSVLYGQYSVRQCKFLKIYLGVGGILLTVAECFGYTQQRLLASPQYIWTYIYSTGVFLLLSENRKMKEFGKNRVVNWISRNSLCIYLIHMVFINVIYKGFHCFPDAIEPVAGGIAVIYIIVLFLTFSVIVIISKVPLLKHKK